jgi:nucleoside-diphosphate-sugar epimerase
MNETHIVLGATGALGSAIVEHLVVEGLPVRALARNTELAESMLPEGVEIASFDIDDKAMLTERCVGGAVVYNCLYIPEKLEALAGTLSDICRETGVRLVFPSNADVYGPPEQQPIPETHPIRPSSERGIKRADVEQNLMRAHEAGEFQVMIPRLASFYGAHIAGSFMSAIFESAQAGRKAFWLGGLDFDHNVLYLPDAAAACVLLAMDATNFGQAWHINGGEPVTGSKFMRLVYEAFGRSPDFAARSRLMFKMAGAVIPEAKRLLEIMYQFDKPFVLSGDKLSARFPDFAYTPVETAVEDTVEWFKREYSSTDA